MTIRWRCRSHPSENAASRTSRSPPRTSRGHPIDLEELAGSHAPWHFCLNRPIAYQEGQRLAPSHLALAVADHPPIYSPQDLGYALH